MSTNIKADKMNKLHKMQKRWASTSHTKQTIPNNFSTKQFYTEAQYAAVVSNTWKS